MGQVSYIRQNTNRGTESLCYAYELACNLPLAKKKILSLCFMQHKFDWLTESAFSLTTSATLFFSPTNFP